MKNVIKNENLGFLRKLYNTKTFLETIVHLKKILKFTSEHFLVGHVFFV